MIHAINTQSGGGIIQKKANEVSVQNGSAWLTWTRERHCWTGQVFGAKGNMELLLAAEGERTGYRAHLGKSEHIYRIPADVDP